MASTERRIKSRPSSLKCGRCARPADLGRELGGFRQRKGTGAHLVECRVLLQRLRTCRVQVAGEDRAPLLPRRDRERSHAREPIDNDLVGREGRHEPRVLVWRREFQYTFEKSKRNLQSCSACGREDNEGSVGAQDEIRGELAHHLDDKVGVAGEDLHLKVAVHVVNHVEFVDDGPELGVLLLVRALGRQQGVLGGWTRREGYARRG